MAIVLRYLASGNSQQSIAFLFKVGHSTVNKIANEVCDALWDAFQDYISQPSSECDWKNIVSGFENHWNMPNCLGAVDGKHVAMKNQLIQVRFGIITKTTLVLPAIRSITSLQ